MICPLRVNFGRLLSKSACKVDSSETNGYFISCFYCITVQRHLVTRANRTLHKLHPDAGVPTETWLPNPRRRKVRGLFFPDRPGLVWCNFRWHLGYCNETYLPTRRGFESHNGFWGGSEDYYAHTRGPTVGGGKPGYDFRSNDDPDEDARGKYSSVRLLGDLARFYPRRLMISNHA